MPALRAEPNFELRTRAFVTGLVYDRQAKRVTSVLYTDMKTGEEYEQPADIVVLSSFVFGNTQHCCFAGIGEPYDPRTGKGVVGKNYCYQFEAGGEAFFEGREFNPFMGCARHVGIAIDDFNGENFDHSGLGFFGGGYIVCANGGAPPIVGPRAAEGRAALGQPGGSRRKRNGIAATPASTRKVRSMPTATISWTSIRPTRMRSAVR